MNLCWCPSSRGHQPTEGIQIETTHPAQPCTELDMCIRRLREELLPAASGLSQSQIDGMGCSRGDKHINPSRFTLRGDNMQTVQCDEKGRLQLRPALRRRYGDQFWVVEAPRNVILLPVPADPVRDLREWGKPLQHLSIEEIKRIIDQRAIKEVRV